MVKMWSRDPSLLLLPNVPQPMHKVNPRSVLGTTWWDKERKAAYASTNFHCEACGINKSQVKHLEGHEVYATDYSLGTLTYIKTTPLCPTCHKYIHDGRLLMMMRSGEISQQHYAMVMAHGDAVLAAAGLSKKSRDHRDDEIMLGLSSGRMARWEEWRLIIDTRPYETLVLNQWKDQKLRNTVYIGRGSQWGNPFVIGKDGTRNEVCDRYEKEILPTLNIDHLFGKNLMCFCHPSRCHGHSIQRKLYCLRGFPPKFKNMREWEIAHNV